MKIYKTQIELKEWIDAQSQNDAGVLTELCEGYRQDHMSTVNVFSEEIISLGPLTYDQAQELVEDFFIKEGSIRKQSLGFTVGNVIPGKMVTGTVCIEFQKLEKDNLVIILENSAGKEHWFALPDQVSIKKDDLANSSNLLKWLYVSKSFQESQTQKTTTAMSFVAKFIPLVILIGIALVLIFS